jgi:hypothetical protein
MYKGQKKVPSRVRLVVRSRGNAFFEYFLGFFLLLLDALKLWHLGQGDEDDA